jgi:tRNA(Ile)-lysidine synthase
MKRTSSTQERPPKSRAGDEAVSVRARRHSLVVELAGRLLDCCGLAQQSGGGPDAARTVRVLAAVSGGADSTALLLACGVLRGRRLNGDLRLDVAAVHVHHHLRSEADEDAAFVIGLCDRLGIELAIEHVHPKEQPGNVAENARRLRYDAMAGAARRLKTPFILTAHHAEDQLETMLMALARGTGLDGLAGMPWRRPLGDGLWLCRPLLGVPKAMCESMCRAAAVTWQEDASNLDVSKARARLRRDVLPVLEELWPGAAGRAAATADVVSAAREAWQRLVNESFGPATSRRWVRGELRGLSIPVIADGLRRAALDARPGVADRLGQEQLIEASRAIADEVRRPRRFDWPGGLALRVTSRMVTLDRRKAEKS